MTSTWTWTASSCCITTTNHCISNCGNPLPFSELLQSQPTASVDGTGTENKAGPSPSRHQLRLLHRSSPLASSKDRASGGARPCLEVLRCKSPPLQSLESAVTFLLSPPKANLCSPTIQPVKGDAHKIRRPHAHTCRQTPAAIRTEYSIISSYLHGHGQGGPELLLVLGIIQALPTGYTHSPLTWPCANCRYCDALWPRSRPLAVISLPPPLLTDNRMPPGRENRPKGRQILAPTAA
ncbi:hypothetical protein V8C44DRAFT_61644 [Trichoderma aethiopicum]